MALKYAEDVQQWIVLGTITRHLSGLEPKLGTWGAVAASGVIGVLVAIGFLAMIRS